MQSGVKFNNMCWHEVGKLLRVLYSEHELDSKGLTAVLPVRTLDVTGKKRRVQPSYLEYDSKGDKWLPSQQSPDSHSQQTMMSLLLAGLASWCMKNHLYKFNDVMYQQTEGCPIGLQIAVNISRLVMVKWDQVMLTKLVSINIRVEMMLRYVDDVNLVLRVQRTELNIAQVEKLTAEQVTAQADSIFPGVL